MIFTAEPRRLFLADQSGRLRMVIGWKSAREQIIPVVVDSDSGIPTVVDLDELGAYRYVVDTDQKEGT